MPKTGEKAGGRENGKNKKRHGEERHKRPEKQRKVKTLKEMMQASQSL